MESKTKRMSDTGEAWRSEICRPVQYQGEEPTDTVDTICHLEVEERTIVGDKTEQRHFRAPNGEAAFAAF